MSGHGWVAPLPGGAVARCGGPGMCPACAREQAQAEGCQVPCDPDCESGPAHCWNRHRPDHKPDWHSPDRCDRLCRPDPATEAP